MADSAPTCPECGGTQEKRHDVVVNSWQAGDQTAVEWGLCPNTFHGRVADLSSLEKKKSTTTSCPDCGGTASEPKPVPYQDLGSGHYQPFPVEARTLCRDSFHSGSASQQDERRWELVGSDSVNRGRVAAGPHLAISESVEVMPVSEHQEAMGAKRREAERVVWHVGQQIDRAVSERTAAIVAFLRDKVERGARSSPFQAGAVEAVADAIEREFGDG